MSIMDLNEQEIFRRESLSKLRELGIEPYPAPLYPINTSAAQVKAEFDEEKGNFQDVVIAGRGYCARRSRLQSPRGLFAAEGE